MYFDIFCGVFELPRRETPKNMTKEIEKKSVLVFNFLSIFW
jgi:hypothetical protein